jgi:16S rRNA (cytosine967-C5)-methyltransferase
VSDALNTASDDQQSGPDMLNARIAALSLLDMILSRRMPLDQALEEHKAFAALSARDRAFVRMLVSTVLRRLGQIDALIRQASDRSELPEPPLLLHLLRLGIVQIMFMSIPDHAAVDTAVRLAEMSGLPRQKGFVNAVLRRMTRDGRDWLSRQDETMLNIPDWLMQSWTRDYGAQDAFAIAQASLAEAPLDITVKDPSKIDHWAEILQAAILPTGVLRRLSGGNVQDMPGYHDGMWWIQDAAASLPAKLFGPLSGVTVIDLCAAPGGKTAQMAAAGAQVVALDRSMRRIQRLDENIRRLRLDRQVTTLAADASVWKPKDPVQAVLLDAPCSATGTIRRHPDILHSKHPDDIGRLVDLQSRMLDNAADMLAPGGTLIYCTCSLQKAEGEEQIDRFLARSRGKMRRHPVSADEIGGLADPITPLGDIRILPYHLAAHGGMDGFYIARLVRE